MTDFGAIWKHSLLSSPQIGMLSIFNFSVFHNNVAGKYAKTYTLLMIPIYIIVGCLSIILYFFVFFFQIMILYENIISLSTIFATCIFIIELTYFWLNYDVIVVITSRQFIFIKIHFIAHILLWDQRNVPLVVSNSNETLINRCVNLRSINYARKLFAEYLIRHKTGICLRMRLA